MCMSLSVLLAALSTRAKRWMCPKCPLTDEWVNVMWCSQGYSALKKKKKRKFSYVPHHEGTFKTFL